MAMVVTLVMLNERCHPTSMPCGVLSQQRLAEYCMVGLILDGRLLAALSCCGRSSVQPAGPNTRKDHVRRPRGKKEASTLHAVKEARHVCVPEEQSPAQDAE